MVAALVRTVPVAALLALATGLSGCSSGDAAPPVERGAAPVLASATLTDQVADGSWSTTWRACFDPGPGDGELSGWEVRSLTSEGGTGRVTALTGSCVELGVGQGPGRPEDDPARAAALADATSLRYEARGTRPDGSVTPWSEPVAAGTEG